MFESSSSRFAAMGTRPVRVANCSGYHGDPAEEMYQQATLSDVDFITGDYLAEVNLAGNAEAYNAGTHPGWEETAWQGLLQSIDVIAERGIKVAINGGALNPKGLAEKVAGLISERNLSLNVCFVSGDDLRQELGENMPDCLEKLPDHLDSTNPAIKPPPYAFPFLRKSMPIVSANAYLGARGIVEGFRRGADIVICGRCSDASPVIAAAWYWHNWADTDYDQLAGSLVAGHLIECSAYVTGGNFSGFDQYDPEVFVKPGFPVAEIAADGTCVITKPENTGGLVNTDTVRCQLLYELQGNTYLHSDAKAHLDDIAIEEVGKDRVRVYGVKGTAPPPTTKLAVFYKGGYESQILLNATGYATKEKWNLFEKQLRGSLGDAINQFEILQFQRIGVPAIDPEDQNSSTTYMRVYAQALTEETLLKLPAALRNISLRHFSGFHSALDFRSAIPEPINAYFPGLYPQERLNEKVTFITSDGEIGQVFSAGHPPKFEALGPRQSYDTTSPVAFDKPQQSTRLGDIALARSGDKGSNLNFGLFVHTKKRWDWLRTFMSCDRVKQLMRKDWSDDYFIERVEFPNIFAVHFVVYGILGRGVSSCSRLDGFGKGFADYFRDIVVEVPREIL